MVQQAPIRVYCVDDHGFLIDGLASRIDLEPDMQCVGRQQSAAGLVEAATQSNANIVLLDIEMPGPDSFEAIAEMRRLKPQIRTIVLSAHIRDGYIATARDKGAWGYFSKTDPPRAILDGIRAVARSEYAYGPEIQTRINGSSARNGSPARRETRLERLTDREVEVLRLIGKGLSRADIARLLCRSPKTIDAHHTSIMKKLDIHDRAELTRYAIAEGLVEV